MADDLNELESLLKQINMDNTAPGDAEDSSELQSPPQASMCLPHGSTLPATFSDKPLSPPEAILEGQQQQPNDAHKFQPVDGQQQQQPNLTPAQLNALVQSLGGVNLLNLLAMGGLQQQQQPAVDLTKGSDAAIAAQVSQLQAQQLALQQAVQQAALQQALQQANTSAQLNAQMMFGGMQLVQGPNGQIMALPAANNFAGVGLGAFGGLNGLGGMIPIQTPQGVQLVSAAALAGLQGLNLNSIGGGLPQAMMNPFASALPAGFGASAVPVMAAQQAQPATNLIAPATVPAPPLAPQPAPHKWGTAAAPPPYPGTAAPHKPVEPKHHQVDSILPAPTQKPTVPVSSSSTSFSSPATVPKPIMTRATLQPIDGPDVPSLNPNAVPFVPPKSDAILAEPALSGGSAPAKGDNSILPLPLPQMLQSFESNSSSHDDSSVRRVTSAGSSISTAPAPPPPVADDEFSVPEPLPSADVSPAPAHFEQSQYYGAAPPYHHNNGAMGYPGVHPNNPVFVIPTRCVSKNTEGRNVFMCPICENHGFLSEYVLRSHLRAKHGSDASLLVRASIANDISSIVHSRLSQGGSIGLEDVIEALPEDLQSEVKDTTQLEAMLSVKDDFVVFRYTTQELRMHGIPPHVADAERLRVAILGSNYVKVDGAVAHAIIDEQ